MSEVMRVCMKVGVKMKDVICHWTCIVCVNQIATRLEIYQPHSVVLDTTGFKT